MLITRIGNSKLHRERLQEITTNDLKKELLSQVLRGAGEFSTERGLEKERERERHCQAPCEGGEKKKGIVRCNVVKRYTREMANRVVTDNGEVMDGNEKCHTAGQERGEKM